MIGNDEARATALHSILLSLYGEALYEDENGEPMDPLEIYADLEDRFNISVPETNQNRIQAILLAVGTDAFYNDEASFTAIAESLLDGDLGDVSITGEMGDLSILELMWAIYEVAANRDENVPEFSPGISRRIQQQAENEAQDDGDPDIPVDVQDIEFLRELRADAIGQLRALWGDFPFESELPDPVDILRPLT